MKIVLTVLITIIILSSTSALSQEGKSLLDKNCIRCHYLERIMSKNKSLKAWRRTVKRMSYNSLYGMSADEIEMVAKYLVNNAGYECLSPSGKKKKYTCHVSRGQ
jgi:hypothetical protein